MGCGASSLLSSFDANKCKIQLKMLCIRLDIKIAKERNGAMQDKHKVAELLKGSQEARARILVEHIIRGDFTVESMDLLKLEASILVERFDIVEKEVELTVEVAQMVCSIVYGAYLMGGHIAELKTLGEMLRAKYGRAFVDEVNAHPEKYLPERIMKAIGESGASTINPLIVEAYMVEIAKLKDVEYIPKAVPAHWHTGGAPHRRCHPRARCGHGPAPPTRPRPRWHRLHHPRLLPVAHRGRAHPGAPKRACGQARREPALPLADDRRGGGHEARREHERARQHLCRADQGGAHEALHVKISARMKTTMCCVRARATVGCGV